MFDIRDEEFVFAVSPFERVVDNEADPVNHHWDWIQSWIEFSVSGLKVAFKTEFTVGELKMLKKEFSAFHQAIIAQQKLKSFKYQSDIHQLDMILTNENTIDSVTIDFILRPEPHADSVQVKGGFGLNESYFPDILKRLDEMIQWQN
ncbi:WapI family immunity protein [Pantoea agglomerans]|uniref:WapI family immunity protein n=1 Tax=Enterobacter agglomerans TaxID=549 RepID=UPI00177F19B1|nr:hypothetical protein [Pantoea agglomerans]MBD8129823.1 hypothetical protein [Pantoea agglomerans]